MSRRPFDADAFRAGLLDWFRANARSLPWRADRDPYRVWISEVMLQQTQVAAVIPYFQRFLETFPTIDHLARAPLADVLKQWEGLGYYRRARDLSRAAQIIVENHGGRFPTEAEEVRRLPGFGKYTTNAVLSQAFETRLPILEANSTRLLCRLAAVPGDPKSTANQRRLWRLAEKLLPDARVGEFNQALMELGALVCSPRNPKCGECPLTEFCRAKSRGLIDKIPPAGKRKRIEHVREVAIVVFRKDRVLLVQRPVGGRWAEMWEFPRGEVARGQTDATAAVALLAKLGIVADLGDELLTLVHAVTRFRITLVCRLADFRSGRVQRGLYPNAEWVDVSRLAEYPVSSPQRRIAKVVESGAW